MFFYIYKWNQPPILNDKPRLSTLVSKSATAFAPVAAVNESPIAATTSISPNNEFNQMNLKVCFFLQISFQPGLS